MCVESDKQEGGNSKDRKPNHGNKEVAKTGRASGT
jgi:hypothetical protein